MTDGDARADQSDTFERAYSLFKTEEQGTSAWIARVIALPFWCWYKGGNLSAWIGLFLTAAYLTALLTLFWLVRPRVVSFFIAQRFWNIDAGVLLLLFLVVSALGASVVLGVRVIGGIVLVGAALLLYPVPPIEPDLEENSLGRPRASLWISEEVPCTEWSLILLNREQLKEEFADAASMAILYRISWGDREGSSTPNDVELGDSSDWRDCSKLPASRPPDTARWLLHLTGAARLDWQMGRVVRRKHYDSSRLRYFDLKEEGVITKEWNGNFKSCSSADGKSQIFSGDSKYTYDLLSPPVAAFFGRRGPSTSVLLPSLYAVHGLSAPQHDKGPPSDLVQQCNEMLDERGQEPLLTADQQWQAIGREDDEIDDSRVRVDLRLLDRNPLLRVDSANPGLQGSGETYWWSSSTNIVAPHLTVTDRKGEATEGAKLFLAGVVVALAISMIWTGLMDLLHSPDPERVGHDGGSESDASAQSSSTDATGEVGDLSRGDLPGADPGGGGAQGER